MTVKEDGTVAGYDDYYPFGMVMDGRSGNTSNPDDLYKFTGKERDIETGYDYFGARYYDSRIGRWLSVDPLADKYPGWSPYNYCVNNPLRFIDPNGMDVYAGSSDARETILNTLSEKERKFVQFGDNGLLNSELLNKFEDGGGNYTALLALANSRDIFEVLVTNNIVINGKEESFGSIEIDPQWEKGPYSLSTNEIGWTGQTITKQESYNGNIKIAVNKNLSKMGRAETFAHEGYGHAYFMAVGKNSDHYIISGIEHNIELKNQIINRMAETRKNMVRK